MNVVVNLAQAGRRADPARRIIARLRACLDPLTLGAAMASAGCGSRDWDVTRVHANGTGRYVLELSSRTQPTRTLIAELSAEPAEVRVEKLRASLAKPKRNQLADTTPSTRLYAIPALGLVVRERGLDEKIDGLSTLVRPELLDHCRAAAGTHFASGAPLRAELLAHRLHKRAVVRVSDGRNSAILKLYKRHSLRSGEVVALMRRLTTSSPAAPRIPAPLADVPALTGHLMEAIDARPLDDLDAASAADEYQAAGALIARLHASGASVATRFGPDDEIALLQRIVATTGAILPELEADLSITSRDVADRLGRCRDFTPALVHRDVHEKQVLLTRGEPVLIDFDTAAMGDPAQDVGNFLAHLDLRQQRLGGRTAVAAAAFLDGVGKHPMAFWHRVEAHRASTLLRLVCIAALTSHERTLAKRLFDLL